MNTFTGLNFNRIFSGETTIERLTFQYLENDLGLDPGSIEKTKYRLGRRGRPCENDGYFEYNNIRVCIECKFNYKLSLTNFLKHVCQLLLQDNYDRRMGNRGYNMFVLISDVYFGIFTRNELLGLLNISDAYVRGDYYRPSTYYKDSDIIRLLNMSNVEHLYDQLVKHSDNKDYSKMLIDKSV